MEEMQNEQAGRRELPPSTGRRLFFFLVAALVIIVDHVTKLIIENWLPLNHTWAPVPELAHLFRITHVSNTGAAFGLFPGGSLFFTAIALIVAVVIIIYNYQLPRGSMLLRLALGLQLGGALGNLIDRLRLGHVTDFLDFSAWPVFNLADTAIVAGVIILGYLMIQEEMELRRAAKTGEGEDEETRAPLSPSLSQHNLPSNHEQQTT